MIWTEVHCVLCATCCNDVLAYLSETIHELSCLVYRIQLLNHGWTLVPKHNREPRKPTLCRLWTEASTITSSSQKSQVGDLLHLNSRCLHLLACIAISPFLVLPCSGQERLRYLGATSAHINSTYWLSVEQ